MRKYEDVIHYLKTNYIEKETFGAQTPLPSIRVLMERTGYSKNSVLRAYQILEQEHLIYSIPQSGYYVVRDLPKGCEERESKGMDFRSSNPDPRALPYKEFMHCMTRVGELYDRYMLWYPEAVGCLSLRTELEKLLQTRQVFSHSEQICITNGVQEAISVFLSMPYPWKSRNLLLEEPGYPVVFRLARQYGWTIHTIPRTEDGYCLRTFRKLLEERDIAVFYCMPRFHNPTGASLSSGQKKKVAQLLEEYGVFLLEDDYLYELDPVKGNLPLNAYMGGSLGSYLAGFSKSFMPGIRIGGIALAKSLCDCFSRWKHDTTLGTTMLDQCALALFLQNGMYEKHQKKMVSVYAHKMDYFKRLWEQLLPERLRGLVQVRFPVSGYYLLFTWQRAFPGAQVCAFLEKEGVLVSEAEAFWPISKASRHGIRLCISQISEQELSYGVVKLIKALERFL